MHGEDNKMKLRAGHVKAGITAAELFNLQRVDK